MKLEPGETRLLGRFAELVGRGGGEVELADPRGILAYCFCDSP